MNRWPRWTLAAGLCLGTACHHKVTKLSAAGKHEQAVAEAQKGRQAPKGKAARAFARSLVATGETERARAVYLQDFVHGGQVQSLRALADFELSRGLQGIAALHYARVMALDEALVEGDLAVCELFRRRAKALFSAGEAWAADADLRRVSSLCGKQRDATLRAADLKFQRQVRPFARREVSEARAAGLRKTKESAASSLAASRGEGLPLDEEIVAALAAGDAARALTRLDQSGEALKERWGASVAVAVTLERLTCGDRCPELPRELTPERLAALPVRMPIAEDASGCRSLLERLSPGSSTGLSTVMRIALDPAQRNAAVTGRELVSALESEPAMVCGTRFVPSLLLAGGHRNPALTLERRLAHAPPLEATAHLRLHAELAAIAGRPESAWRSWSLAAAQSSRPALEWRRAAISAYLVGARDLERRALKAVLQHSEADPAAEFSLVRSRLQDAERDPTLQTGVEASLQEYARVVARYLDRLPANERGRRWEDLWAWWSHHAWADQPSRELARASLEAGRAAHSEAFAAPVPGRQGQLAELRRALLGQLASGAATARRKAALGLAVLGDAHERARGLQYLWGTVASDPARAGAFVEFLQGSPAVTGAVALPAASYFVPLLADEGLVVAVLYQLDLEAWTVAS